MKAHRYRVYLYFYDGDGDPYHLDGNQPSSIVMMTPLQKLALTRRLHFLIIHGVVNPRTRIATYQPPPPISFLEFTARLDLRFKKREKEILAALSGHEKAAALVPTRRPRYNKRIRRTANPWGRRRK